MHSHLKEEVCWLTSYHLLSRCTEYQRAKSLLLPTIIIAKMDGGSVLRKCHVSFRYLAKNSSSLFTATDYEVAPPEYHRKAV